MKSSKFAIDMRFFSVFFLLLAFVALFFSGLEMRKFAVYTKQQLETEKSRRLCEEKSQSMANASDLLTSNVWHFIATADTEYLDNYWLEVDTVRTRDKIIEGLDSMGLTEDEQSLLLAAKQKSDALIDGEAWAMRLVADSIGLDKDKMPERVASVQYRRGEQDWSSEEKRTEAMLYIFGDEYTQVKKAIYLDLSTFRSLLSDRKNAEFAQAMEHTQYSLRSIKACNILTLALFVTAIAMFYLFVTRPFKQYALALSQTRDKEFPTLKPAGSRETQAFAQVYNRIHQEWRKQKEELEHEKFRFHVAVENTSAVVYEYDMINDVYTSYGRLDEEETELQTMDRVLPDFWKTHVDRIIEEPFLAEFHKSFDPRRKNGASIPKVTELRLFPGSKRDKAIWVRIIAVPFCDAQGNISRIIGTVDNIESEKRKELALEEVRSRDNLTGLYNKDAGIRLVQQYMEKKSPQEICGLMLMDIDDFQKVNQKEGPAFADAVLQEIADILRANTGPEDILIRLGGDEFMLFVKDCPKSRATVLGPQIAAKIGSLSNGKSEGLTISASIGMCVTQVVDEYSGLYRCAESTLKYVKENCRGTAACYLDTSNELGTMLTQLYTEKHFINDIDRAGDYQKEDLISFALELLGKSKNMDDAVSLLFARIGRYYKADRVSILDVNRDYLSCRFSYQWAKNTADLRLGKTYYLTGAQLEEVTSSYDENGLCRFYILPHTGISSCLHAAIWDRGAYVGCLCLEVWQENYSWTGEEETLLTELTKIISSFILKAQADALSQAKTDFLSRMSHEIRTPMNAITGITEIAKGVAGDKERTLECISTIESANHYLLNLINDILDMSRIESGKMELNPERLDLRRHLDNLENMMRTQAESKELTFTVINSVPENRPVMADGMRLNQVLINLIGNAVKFTGEGGSITVTAETKEITDTHMTVYFSIEDTGIGIAPEAIERIFNVFEQADRSTSGTYGGTGLGLSISSRLVQMMSGALDVDSKPGVGSNFHFALPFPLASGEEKAPPFSEEEPKSSASLHQEMSGKRILLVEDNDLNRKIAQTILEMNQLLVETAVNGKDAVERFAASEPHYYDAILMDIRMPVLNGLDATKQIRTLEKEDSRSIPIIAMTANAFDEDMKRSLDSGMNGHLSKPIEVDKLLAMLSKCLQRSEDS